MRLKWKESDFKDGIMTVKAVLIYGADAGQVDEMFDKAIEKLGIEKDNLFAVDSGELKDRQDALFAEACSPSMFGGRRMVMIANAGDSDAPIVRELVAQNLEAFVVITSGELRAGSGLRGLFEGAPNLAALPCYADDERSLSALIQKELFGSGIRQIAPDAMHYMCGHLGSDRGITRSFLKKIALYVDDKKVVSLEDAKACLPDSGAASMDDFLYSLTAGYIAQTMTALDRLFYDDGEPIMLVRMLTGHFKRLLMAVSGGQIPRVFWKYQTAFDAARKIWTDDEIIPVLARLNELEKQTKTTGMPSEILLRDFALKLSIRAAKLKIKKK